MQTSVLYDGRAVSTPSERLFADRHQKARARIAARAYVPGPIQIPITEVEVETAIDVVNCSTDVVLISKSGQVTSSETIRQARVLNVDLIQRTVATAYGVSRHDMLSARRTANVVRPRQIAMYLAKTMTLRSLPEIGRRFGGRDHTTVLHAIRKMDALVAKDESLASLINDLKIMIVEAST